MDWHSGQTKKIPKIPTNLFTYSRKYLQNSPFASDTLYRGLSQLTEQQLKKFKTKGATFTKTNPSWTLDVETARAFAFGLYDTGVVFSVPVSKVKHYLLIDALVELLLPEQIASNPNEISRRVFKSFISESEVLVFDTLILPPANIVKAEPYNYEDIFDEDSDDEL